MRWWQILGVVSITIGVILGWPSEPTGDEGAAKSVESTASRVRSQGVPLTGSAEARAKLMEVVSGRRKVPDWSKNLPAWRRYHKDTRAWIDALSLEDCLVLIEEAEAGRRGGFLDQLYIRRAFLDPEGAMETVAGDPSKLRRKGKLHLLCWALRGWARRSPADAWSHFNQWTRDDGYNPIRESGEATEITRDVFAHWVKVDRAAAFEHLLEIEAREFEGASCSYYKGLQGLVDYSVEASKLERLLKNDDFSLVWGAVGETANQTLSLFLATKWIESDAGAALEWWQTRDWNGVKWNEVEKRNPIGLAF